ncbi:hypothetical protein MLD38_016397 [Melastoma candidum]|uniref:Uncharacterized protein n=1 Tax=Melastoma candidum TaxID=119954 RepID=A0ACB9RL89_9MYRT|nr:hypothetical protein MLD38_016397 [Melastoma candidum]
MALRFSPSSPAHATPSSGATPAPAQPPSGIRFLSASSSRQLHRYGPRPGGRPQRPFVVSCTVDAAVVNIGQVTEVNKDSFWPIVRAAGDKAVVLDMYTQWYAFTGPYSLCSCCTFACAAFYAHRMVLVGPLWPVMKAIDCLIQPRPPLDPRCCEWIAMHNAFVVMPSRGATARTNRSSDARHELSNYFS